MQHNNTIYRTYAPMANSSAGATSSVHSSNAGARGFRHTASAAPVGTVYPSIVIQEPTLTVPHKAKRKRITQSQFEVLQGSFMVCDTPSHDVRAALAQQLDMSPREVQVWFQNRRAKYNRERAIKRQKESQANVAMAMIESGQVARGHDAHSAAAQSAEPTAAATAAVAAVAQPAIAATPTTAVAAHRHRSHSESLHQGENIQPRPAPAYMPAGSQPHLSSYVHIRAHTYAHPHHHTLSAVSPVSTSVRYPSSYTPRTSDGLTISVPVAAAICPLQTAAPHTAPAQPSFKQVTGAYSTPHISDYRAANYNRQSSLAPAQAANDADSQSWGVSSSHSAQAASILQSPTNELLPMESGSVVMASCSVSESSLDYVTDTRYTHPSRRNTVSGTHIYPSATGYSNPAAQGQMKGATPAAMARTRYASAVPSEPLSQSGSSTRRSLSPRVRTVRLPSIQVMLSSAGAAAANMKAQLPSPSHTSRTHSSTSSSSTLVHQDSPSAGPNLPPIHDLAPAVRVLHTRGLPAHSAARGGPQLLELPFVDDMSVRDVKFGIDMLATAAVSVSTGRTSMPLPHLTPLTEFSHRASSGTLHANAPSQAPGAPSASHQGSEQGQHRGVPTRKVTPYNNANKKPSTTKWRPW